jgi:acyl-CoA synthetase (AMP-forming)/AMP-acid ligase II
MSESSIINNTNIQLDSSLQNAKGEEEFLITHPWVRHYEQGVPAHIVIPNQPLTWLIDRASSLYPGHTAFIYYGKKLTYAEFSHYANCFAIELQRLGVRKSDRVAIALPNIPQYPIAFYGALKAGATVVPTNPLYTGREMLYQLADSEARVIVMLDTLYPIVRAVRKQTGLEHIIVTSPADFLPPVLRIFHTYGLTVCMNFSILIAAAMVLLPRFQPKDVVQAIRQYHPTLFPGIPTMYLAIMRETVKHPDDLKSIKYCISGAAPLPAKVRSDFEAIPHGRLVEGYGLSEAGPVTHCNPLTDECRNGSTTRKRRRRSAMGGCVPATWGRWMQMGTSTWLSEPKM